MRLGARLPRCVQRSASGDPCSCVCCVCCLLLCPCGHSSLLCSRTDRDPHRAFLLSYVVGTELVADPCPTSWVFHSSRSTIIIQASTLLLCTVQYCSMLDPVPAGPSMASTPLRHLEQNHSLICATNFSYLLAWGPAVSGFLVAFLAYLSFLPLV